MSTFQATAKIPAGAYDGAIFKSGGLGHQSLSGRAGDVLTKIKIRPDPHFSRNGADILSNEYITATDAILGSTLKVKTLYEENK